MGKNISGSDKLAKSSIELRHTPPPPPWEILSLVARYLDPITLARGSCVSKQWSVCFSSDNLWESHCTARFFSLMSLHHPASVSIPYHRLYSLGMSADRRCHWRRYIKPILSLENLLFTISLYSTNRACGGGYKYNGKECVVITGRELELNPHGMFSFEVNLGRLLQDHHHVAAGPGGNGWVLDLVGPLRMTWNVVLDGWKGVFTLMDEVDNGSQRVPVAAGPGGMISKELPGPGCCPSGKGSGLVANMRLQIRDEMERNGRGKESKGVAVEKVRVGLLNMSTWSELSLEDGLLYLQHFLC